MFMLNMVKVTKLEVSVCKNTACKSNPGASDCPEGFVCRVNLQIQLTSHRLNTPTNARPVRFCLSLLFHGLFALSDRIFWIGLQL